MKMHVGTYVLLLLPYMHQSVARNNDFLFLVLGLLFGVFDIET